MRERVYCLRERINCLGEIIYLVRESLSCFGNNISSTREGCNGMIFIKTGPRIKDNPFLI